MLLKITEVCTMGCTHCGEECLSSGRDMSIETFLDTLEFIRKTKPRVIVVTGGEPIYHPNFFFIIEELQKIGTNINIIVTSNGLFLNNKELTKKVLELNIPIQITNDKRYYPKSIPYIEHKNLDYVYEIQQIYPMGRAISNKIPIFNVKAPKCFNIRSIARTKKEFSFSDVIKLLESYGKFCTPSITIDGIIKAGEFKGCNSIGSIYNSDEILLKNLRSLNCNNCGMEDILSSDMLRVIRD